MEKYRILGVSKDCPDEEVRAAYRTLALKWHPDRCRTEKETASEKFIEINSAYQAILNERERLSKLAKANTTSPSSKAAASPASPETSTTSSPESPKPNAPQEGAPTPDKPTETSAPPPPPPSPSNPFPSAEEPARGRSSSRHGRSHGSKSEPRSDTSPKSRKSSPSPHTSSSDSDKKKSKAKSNPSSRTSSKARDESPKSKKESRSSRKDKDKPKDKSRQSSRNSSPHSSKTSKGHRTRSPSSDARSTHSSTSSSSKTSSSASSSTEHCTPDQETRSRNSSRTTSPARSESTESKKSSAEDDCKKDDNDDTAQPSKTHRSRLRKQSRPTSRRPEGPDGTPRATMKKRKSEIIDEERVSEINLDEYAYPLPDDVLEAREWCHTVYLSLEELYHGKSIPYRFTRHQLSGKKKNVVLDLNVPAGCRDRMKIIFRSTGHERKSDGTKQDIVFVIREKEHERFTRAHDDLYMDIRLPWVESLNEEPGEVFFQGIDGREYMFQVNYKRDHGLEGTHTISRAGMPAKDGSGKGKLIVRWEIVQPESPKWETFNLKDMLGFGG